MRTSGFVSVLASLVVASAGSAATLVATTDKALYAPGETVTITLTGTTVPYAPTGVEATDAAQSIDVRIVGAGFTSVSAETGAGGTCIAATGCIAGASWSAGGTQGLTISGLYTAFSQIGGLAPSPLTNNMNASVPPFLTGDSSLSSLFTLTASVVPGNYPINLADIGVGFFGVSGPQQIGSYTVVVPEPTTAALMSLGLLGLAAAGRRS